MAYSRSFQDNFPGYGHTLMHGVSRMAASIGQLRNLEDLVLRRAALDVKKIAEPLSVGEKILERKPAVRDLVIPPDL